MYVAKIYGVYKIRKTMFSMSGLGLSGGLVHGYPKLDVLITNTMFCGVVSSTFKKIVLLLGAPRKALNCCIVA